MKPLSAYQTLAVDKFFSILPQDVKSILEIGSDVEYAVVDYMAERFSGKVVGINPVAGFVKREAAEGPPNVELLEASGCDQPFEGRSFDAIISIATMEHVFKLSTFLEECHRVLKPGGIFYTNFGPIWSSGIGHHVCAFAGRKEARFWKPDRNPLPDFSHLLWDTDEMRKYLFESPYDDRLIDPIIEWVYHSNNINRLFYEDYLEAFTNCRLEDSFLTPTVYKIPPTDILTKLKEKHGPGREFKFHNIESAMARPIDACDKKGKVAIPVCFAAACNIGTDPAQARTTNKAFTDASYAPHAPNVVINFHQKDQHSTAALLHLLMEANEGTICTYYIQYGDGRNTLEINNVIKLFQDRKKAVVSFDLPPIDIPEQLRADDPNILPYSGNFTMRNRKQKDSILQWNLCVYKHIQLLDSFLMVEPDCVILKDGWLDEIFTAYQKGDSPIFGHLKKGLIGNRLVPTHWAGCSIYNGRRLRKLPLKRYFLERYDNPWWRFRNETGTTTANNCFYGPAFSGYDISYDYFLFALYMKETSGSNDPSRWPLNDLVDRSDLIFCDFRSRLSANEIQTKFADRLPLMHGVKGDEIRARMAQHFSHARRSIRRLNSTAQAGHGDSKGLPATSAATESAGSCGSLSLKQGCREERFLPEERIFDLSNQKLAGFKDIHKGGRCIIIGNGPSLNRMDLSFLKKEITFGMNRIYLMYDKYPFLPTYYASVNPLVLEQSAKEIIKINVPKFLSHKGIPFFQNPPEDLMFIRSLPKWVFSNDPRHGLCEGWTVTYFVMQLAFYMGFHEVVLIGVDHHFVTQGDPNKEVLSQGDDPNHFHPGYFGKGVRWHLPDLERSEKSYRMAKQAFESDGRRILDATVDGRLTVFPRVDYRRHFKLPFLSTALPQTSADPTVQAVLHQAQNMLDCGQLSEACSLLENGIDTWAAEASLPYALGLLHEHRGEKMRAVPFLETAVKLAPENMTYLKRLAMSYHQTCGKSVDALRLLRKMFETEPNDLSTLQLIGDIFQAMGLMDEARYFIKTAERLIAEGKSSSFPTPIRKAPRIVPTCAQASS